MKQSSQFIQKVTKFVFAISLLEMCFLRINLKERQRDKKKKKKAGKEDLVNLW